jgi:hypothetical protein
VYFPDHGDSDCHKVDETTPVWDSRREEGKMGKLNVKALAIAGGVMWGVYMLFIGWFSWLFNWGTNFVVAMSSVYIWFRPTFIGGIIGAIWGFLDGAFAGAIIAWVYNMAAKKN